MTRPPSAVALVTGASKGIGRGCAEALHRAGFRVALHYRSDSALARKLQSTLPGSELFQHDLSQDENCQQLVKQVQQSMGTISVLVNNAGVSRDAILPTARAEDLELIFQTNFRAAFLLSKLVCRPMMKQRWGRIINITSVVGHKGHRGQGLYSASKAALTAFTQSTAAELGRFGILCNCIAPGYIATQMTDDMPEQMEQELLKNIHLGRVGRSEEVGDVAAFLASSQASYITGTTLHVNGGMYGC